MISLTIILLFIALLPLPYGYYILLKFLVCFTAIRQLCVAENMNVDNNLVWTAIVILYNPIIKIPLGRTIWVIVNILTAIYFIYYLKNKRRV